MGLDLEYKEGETPLDDEEKEGLRIPTIATRGELDEFEQQNIEMAVQWSLGRSLRPEVVFTEAFICQVHKRMFGTVWTWAGTFRNTNKNIGTDKWQIPVALHQLLEDLCYWHEHQTYPPDEIALRFKHRLVSIHCFANGNGRHSRLLADIIISKVYKLPVFTWGFAHRYSKGTSGISDGATIRAAYLRALKAADRGDYSLLLEFARS